MIDTPFDFFKTPDEILAQTDPALLKQSRDIANYWINNFHDDPTRVTGYYHNYSCPKCAAELTFDLDNPREHTCVHCGFVPEGIAIDQAWVYNYRINVAHGMEQVGLWAYLGDDTAYDCLIRVISFYAEHYHNFVSERTTWYGKLFWQVLDEAVWCDSMLLALRIAGFDFSSEIGRKWYADLFNPMAELLFVQAHMIHNIPLWQMSAIFGVGLFFDRPEWVDKALNSEFGVRNQIGKGFTADGMWYENATGYHFYTLEAFTRFCVFLTAYDSNDPLLDVLDNVYDVFEKLSYDGWQLPSTNDTGYPMTWAGGYKSAYRAWLTRKSPKLAGIVSRITEREPTLTAMNLESIYGGLPPRDVAPYAPPTTAILPTTGLVMLRGDFSVLLKYGLCTPSHAHPDLLSIDIFPFALDIGTVRYGSEYSPTWTRTTISHNTFNINGKKQSGIVMGKAQLSKNGVTATVKDAYPGVIATRSLLFKDGALNDELSVCTPEPSTIDYMFSAYGEFTQIGAPCAPLGDEDGYQHLKDTCITDDTRFVWKLGGQTLILDITPPPNARVYLCKSPANPVDILRNALVIRVENASKVSFKCKFIIEKST